jgi:hypothetical protein
MPLPEAPTEAPCFAAEACFPLAIREMPDFTTFIARGVSANHVNRCHLPIVMLVA